MLFLSGAQSVIEEATYSGILLPSNEWKALSHLGHTARMAYRVRVRCDRNYYGQTCTKLCKPRDDRFGHYTCGDTDGRKECIPGWQGENCDKGELTTNLFFFFGNTEKNIILFTFNNIITLIHIYSRVQDRMPFRPWKV